MKRFLLHCVLAVCTAGAAGLAIVPASAQPAWQPDHNVEIVATSAAGGLNDEIGRVIQSIARTGHIVPVSMTVVNRPGGGGVIALNELRQHPGDAQYLVDSSADVLTGNIVGQSTLTYHDFTPLAVLFHVNLAVAVRADSPLRDIHDFINALKQNPQVFSFGLATSLGNYIHASLAIPLQQQGVDIRKLKIAVFNSGAEAVTNLAGGHVDVAVGAPSDVVGLLGDGKLRVLAISAPQRLGGALSGVPTWREQGIPFDFAAPYFTLGPPGLSPAQIAFWADALRKITAQPEWQQQMQRHFLVPDFRGPAETMAYLANEDGIFRSALSALGLAKTP